jgi:hypothetical protein
MKIDWLSCSFCRVIRVKKKKMYIINHKQQERVNVLWCGDAKGKISIFLNKFLHEALLLHPTIILIIFFWILNIFWLWGEFPQNGKP